MRGARDGATPGAVSEHSSQPLPPAVARTTGADEGARPPIRWGGRHPALWVGAMAALAVTWCVTLLVAAYQSLTNGGLCFEPADVTGLQAAQRGMVLLLAVLTVPWLLAVRASLHRTRTTVLAAVALAPVCLIAARMLASTPQEFSSSWCLC
jgi:hypothetical protein